LRASSGNFSLESAVTGGASAAGGGSMSEVKVRFLVEAFLVEAFLVDF
jgi:hypothetical protein